MHGLRLKETLFYTMTNNCTIISQIITLLYVSTLSCHPQGACNQHLAELQLNIIYNIYFIYHNI